MLSPVLGFKADPELASGQSGSAFYQALPVLVLFPPDLKVEDLSAEKTETQGARGHKANESVNTR